MDGREEEGWEREREKEKKEREREGGEGEGGIRRERI
jgi:hypothetical protein